ncbi:oligosaccharide flippase family protein [Vibrio parahaemolyticus]|nr:oligosaccharide flippase family protein [Vibrio parahaemolyticus]
MILSKKNLSNISWLTIERFLVIFLLIASEGVIAKNLSTEQYGLYQYCLNISLIIVVSISFVPSEIVIPKLSYYKHCCHGIVVSIVLLRSVIGFTFLFLIGILNEFLISSYKLSLILAFVLCLLIGEVSGAFVNYYQAKVRMKVVSFLRVLSLLFRYLMLLVVSKYQLQLDTITIIRIAEGFLLLLLLVGLYLKDKQVSRKKHYNYKKISNLFICQGSRVWLTILIYYLLLRIDRVAVEKFFSLNAVGIYSISQQIIDQVMTLFVIVINVLLPSRVFNTKNKKEKLTNLIKIIKLISITSLVSFCIVKTTSPLFIMTVYGDKYIAALEVLTYMSLILPFNSLDYMFSQFLISENKARFVFFKNLSSLVLLILLYLSVGRSLELSHFPLILVSVNMYMVLLSSIYLWFFYVNNKDAQIFRNKI